MKIRKVKTYEREIKEKVKVNRKKSGICEKKDENKDIWDVEKPDNNK